MPSSTPSASSPGMPRRLATWAPTATRIGPKPCSRRPERVKSLPGLLAVLDAHPEFAEPGQVGVDALLRQAVGGDGPAHHAPGIGVLLEDGDLDTRPAPSMRAAERPAGPAPMIATLLPARRGPLPHRRPGLLGHDEPLHLADGQRLVVVGADAGVLAPVVADVAQDRGQRVVAPGDGHRVGVAPLPHRRHVLRHVLVHRAFVGAGGRRCSRTGPAAGWSWSAPSRRRPCGSAAPGSPRRHSARRFARCAAAVSSAPATRRAKSSRSAAPTASIAAPVSSRYCSRPQVPARLAAGRCTPSPGAARRPASRGALKQSAPPAKDSGIPPRNSSASSRREVDGEGVEGTARQVHHRVAGEHRAPVLHLEGVAQLEPEVHAPGRRQPPAERRNMGTASSHFRSWPKAASGTTTSP